MNAVAAIRDLFEGMNKTERARASELEALRRSGQIAEWWYEQWTFKLADDCRFIPDFVIQEKDGSLRVEEVKGFWRDDAKVKVRVFAKTFPLPITVLKLRRGGGWDVEEF